ncbi:MAG: low affinity iron permease family protein [Agriterribacter sp.]
MKTNQQESKPGFFERISAKATIASGSTAAIIVAFGGVLIWGVLGPVFKYSEGWQMVINTGTTIITFLMVFLIQKSQNKESIAVQLKLNELVAAHEFASNRLVDVENMTEDELKVIQKYYSRLKIETKKEESLQQSHSIDEATKQHELKKDIEEDIQQRVAGKHGDKKRPHKKASQ